MNFCGYKMYLYYMQDPYSLFCPQPKLYVLPGIDSQKGTAHAKTQLHFAFKVT